MARIIKYYHEYYDYESHISIPELNGLPLLEKPYEYFDDDNYLDTYNYSYRYEFDDPCELDENGDIIEDLEEIDDSIFRDFKIIKMGGSGETAHGDEFYDQLTEEEADAIVKEFIHKALGLTDFEVIAESPD